MKIFRSFSYAFKGIQYLFRNEFNSRIHLVIACITVFTGWYFRVSKKDWIILILCIALVFAAELFNTAIEKTVDYISKEQNPSAGMIKDISAGAVLIISTGAAVSGLIIFYPYLFK